ncbi:class I SAM-dependent methyltransferase [bacterium]|nr:class I SAM-dependent methyltransferase [bacterium]
MSDKFYPDSKVEVRGVEARHYDFFMNAISLGTYPFFLKKAINKMLIQPDDVIADFGAGSGRNALLMHSYLSDKGSVVGYEIGEEMIASFRKNSEGIPNISLRTQRVDEDIAGEKIYDKILMSFVLHGLPHEYRLAVLSNVQKLLKKGGSFFILDYTPAPKESVSSVRKFLFTKVECPHSYDFIIRDWNAIFKEYGLHVVKQQTFMKWVSLIEVQAD